MRECKYNGFIQLNRFDVLQRVYHNKLTRIQLKNLMKHKKVRYSFIPQENHLIFTWYEGGLGKNYFEWDYYLLLFMNNIIKHEPDEIIIFDKVTETIEYVDNIMVRTYDVKYNITKIDTREVW